MKLVPFGEATLADLDRHVARLEKHSPDEARPWRHLAKLFHDRRGGPYDELWALAASLLHQEDHAGWEWYRQFRERHRGAMIEAER